MFIMFFHVILKRYVKIQMTILTSIYMLTIWKALDVQLFHSLMMFTFFLILSVFCNMIHKFKEDMFDELELKQES